MNTGITIEIIYFMIGFILANKWFNDDYKKEYEKADDKEKGMACLVLLFMCVFWPVRLIYSLVSKNKI